MPEYETTEGVLKGPSEPIRHSIPPTAAEHFRRFWCQVIASPARTELLRQPDIQDSKERVRDFSSLIRYLGTGSTRDVLETFVTTELTAKMRTFVVQFSPLQQENPGTLRQLEERVKRLEQRIANLESRPELPLRVLPEEGDPFELLKHLRETLGERRFLSFAEPE